MDVFTTVTLQLLQGFGETLNVFVMTLLFSIPLGLVVCLGSMSRCSPLRWLVRGFIWIIRGTPLMLQLMVIFYGPGLMFGLPALPRFTAVIVAFAINVGEYWLYALCIHSHFFNRNTSQCYLLLSRVGFGRYGR